MIGRAGKLLLNAVRDVHACPHPIDKLAVALAAAGRVVTVLAENVACRLVRRPVQIWPPDMFLLRDVTVVNEDGRFHCRRGTSDHAVVRPDYERDLREFFTLNAGVFVDVGAHVGKYVVAVGRQLGDRGRVIAVEPDPGNAASLRRNVRANGLRNVTISEAACGRTDGRGVLRVARWEPIRHAIADSAGEGPEVTVRSLDSLLGDAGVRRIDLLKIDAEGMEEDVLLGACRVLRDSTGARVIVEVADDRALRLLRDMGFALTRTAHRFGRDGTYWVAARPHVTVAART